jgi:hypothetical protein
MFMHIISVLNLIFGIIQCSDLVSQRFFRVSILNINVYHTPDKVLTSRTLFADWRRYIRRWFICCYFR